MEIIKSIILGIIQGITEWLPISSTGHMILFNSFFPLDIDVYSGGKEFVELFMTVIQLGSMLAVFFIFFDRLNFLSRKKTIKERNSCLSLWSKIIIGSLPAAFVGFIFKDIIHEFLYNGIVVSLMLILYGIFFIVAENISGNSFTITRINMLNFKTVLLIGMFQALALVPGTSRSGATILGALILGCSRSVGAEFSFFLAMPTMAGASLLEILSYFKHNGIGFLPIEYAVLAVGFTVAFLVSMFVIFGFMRFVKKHNFKVFAYYRIFIGLLFMFLFFTDKIKV